MTRHTAARLVASAVLVTSAGCGQAAHTTSPAGGPAPSPPCPATVTLTEADNGRTLCLTQPGHLEVYLHGTARDRWQPITLEGDALRRAASGKATLVLGVTGGFFTTAHVGTVHLSSARRPCGTPAPGVTCGPLRTFKIAITVR
ncbi:MAG: hypothetical protein JWN52_5404 [Actinomycetia bacterium]|nr:hypothetical protein [Actinomycetes bacterium]